MTEYVRAKTGICPVLFFHYYFQTTHPKPGRSLFKMYFKITKCLLLFQKKGKSPFLINYKAVNVFDRKTFLNIQSKEAQDCF